MSENRGGLFNLDISKLADTLKAVDTPIKLSALTTIVALIVLIFAFTKISSGPLQTALIVIMSGAIVLSPIVTITLDSKKMKQQNQADSIPIDYGAFISAPMDAANDREWEEHRRRMRSLVVALERYCEMREVFYAGDLYPTKGKWQTPDLALRENFRKLKASNKFIMIFPRKTSSSILVEAGMALALRKDAVFFARNPDELPFLLRRAANASSQDNLPRISIYKYNNFNEIIDIIERDGSSLFR